MIDNDTTIKIFETNAQLFLQEFQDRVIQGYRLKDVPMYFPVGIYELQMYREIPWERPKKDNVVFPEHGPYTEAMMKEMDFQDLKQRVNKEYNITGRERQIIIKRVLKFYEENNNSLAKEN